MLEKLKSILADDTLFIALLLCFVAIASFGLGRVSVGERNESTPAARVQFVATSSVLVPLPTLVPASSSQAQGASVVTATTPASAISGPYVGSKTGTKYYLDTCAGAKRIKDENKVFFATEHDAAAAGYTPASNCKGI